ncbi:hypothetical protein [Demequina sp. SO4-18]|uniref:hypothetical protein n=1 Tax=Demequina sp. SO4-18 TaxID=3401026 RepID=UPI003B59948A
MSEMPAEELPLRTAGHERAITYGQLESRLMRLERLESGAPDVTSGPPNAPLDSSASQARTSVVFSDERR